MERNDFDHKAKTWDEDPMKVERSQTVANAIRKKLNNSLFKTGIEYGCGTGLLGLHLKDQFQQLILADTSLEMINILKEKIVNQNINNCIPLHLNPNTTVTPDPVDVLFSLMLLHHIADIEKILTQWKNTLTTDGMLMIADIDEEDGSFHIGGDTEHNGIHRQNLITTLSQMGFHSISDETVYVIKKDVNGVEKEFPVFLICATRS